MTATGAKARAPAFGTRLMLVPGAGHLGLADHAQAYGAAISAFLGA